MSASLTPYRRACSASLVFVFCAACATYVDEPTAPGMASLTGGKGGEAGSDPAGSGGSEPGASGNSAGASVSAGSDSGGVGNGGAGAGGGGAGSGGGAGAGAGGGGMGGSGGSAGNASGGAAGAGGAGGSGGKATGGSGGSGGSGSVQTCAMRPIPAKSSWKLSASHSQPNGFEPVGNAHDGNLTNRWSTGKDQSGNEWLQIDFGVEVQITKLTLVLGSSVNDHPRMYQTRIGNDPVLTDLPAILSGAGQASTDTIMSFPKQTRGRYLRISQHGTATALWWSVAEIQTECVD